MLINVTQLISMKLMILIMGSALHYVPHARKIACNAKVDHLDPHVLIVHQECWGIEQNVFLSAQQDLITN